MRDEGAPVRFIRSIFVPEDERCFYLFQASSSEEVDEAARRAALPRAGVATAISAERPQEKGIT
jgi:hypothetical protein